MIAIWVALAGGAGAMTRYMLDSLARHRWSVEFPVGTLAINVSGSLILGVLTGLVIAHGSSNDLKTIAGTGFCGGYTTFSVASVGGIRLAENRRWTEFLAYSGGSLLLALLAAGLGLWITGA